MRTQEDLIKIRVELTTILSLDRERITNDPAWAAISDNFDLTKQEQVDQAVFFYLSDYIRRQQLFGDCIFMPATNGPSDLIVEKMENVTHGNDNDNDK